MDVSKICIGSTYAYRSRMHEGRGKVVSIKATKKGPYVRLRDKTRDVTVAVRPSQVGKQ